MLHHRVLFWGRATSQQTVYQEKVYFGGEFDWVVAPKALFRRWVPIQSLRFWDVRGMTLLCLFTLLYAFASPPKPYCFSTASSWAARARSFALLYVRVLPGKWSKSWVASCEKVHFVACIPVSVPSAVDFKMLYLTEFWELWAQIWQGNQPRVEVLFFSSFEPTCQFQN